VQAEATDESLGIAVETVLHDGPACKFAGEYLDHKEVIDELRTARILKQNWHTTFTN
jgi:hypothetical protein